MRSAFLPSNGFTVIGIVLTVTIRRNRRNLREKCDKILTISESQ